jgi:hypothetical protein
MPLPGAIAACMAETLPPTRQSGLAGRLAFPGSPSLRSGLYNSGTDG